MTNIPGFANFEDYDCLDIGADINSLQWARDLLGVKRPLGLNIEEKRLNSMVEAGEHCININAFDIPNNLSFEYIVMSHFLEHLESEARVFEILSRSMSIARNGIFIAGPHFESDTYIRNFGVKFVWGDWIDHRSRFSVSTFIPFLAHKMPGRVTLSLGFPAYDSQADNIVALTERSDIDSYIKDAAVCKPEIKFPRPAFQEFVAFVDCSETGTPAFASEVHRRRHGVDGAKVPSDGIPRFE
jgi:hypothetical protein